MFHWIIIWLPILLLAISAKAEAQTYLWVESQVAVEKESGKVVAGENFATISFGIQRSRWVGLFAQTSHGNLWGETVLGPSFAIGESLNVGIGAGVEHYAPNPLRLRLNAYYDDTATRSFAYFQYDVGEDDSWVWADIAQMFGDHVGAGILIQMPGGGIGPKVELRFGKHIGVWAAPVYEWQERKYRALVGGRLMFDK